MQRRIDDPTPQGPRRVMPGDQFSRVIAPGAPQRFDTNDNPLSTALQYPLANYGQMGQAAPQHLQPPQAVHPPVAAAALSAVHQGGASSASAVHQPPPHQAGASAAPPGNQMAQVPPGGGMPVPPAVSGPQQQQQFQRLKVEDALSYLDQVKLQFGNQPSVYNDFLDIMKEFKSQTIDTPGVINRVSNLFKGHPDLIVGFNTFLPPGYKIEVERDVINVYQPGQASMPISALNAAANASAMSQLQGQAQKSPAHMPSTTPPVVPQAPPPPIHHSYTQPPRPHSDVPLPLSHPAQPASVPSTSPQGGSQPVEFNHAINYVNKIKNRFQGQPEVYKQFLEILHTYQKEQRTIKEGMGGASNKPLTETEVYSQVARLFHNQEDLLAEFGQFLPDANGGGSNIFFPDGNESRRIGSDMALGVRNDHSSTVKKPGFPSKAPLGKTGSQLKRPPCSSSGLQPPSKIRKTDSIALDDGNDGEGIKYKTGILKDVSMAEAGKFASLKEYAFFDQVRNALRHNDVYNNFLRCLILFNSEVISRSELINMVHPFLGKHPELYKWFKEFLGHKESGNTSETIPQGATKERSVRDEYNMEIDYQSCKRYGASYRALPSSYPQPKCSGRTQLCREVLNDTWVSIPTWSEDSTFVTSRKSQFEEHIYKCEDERFELDVVLEMNFTTIKTLETVQRKMQRMNTEEAAKFRLDNTLGGSSEFVARRAICRIYGEKSADIIDGLKKNPVVAVPLVLRRLKSKDEEWRDAQKSFNKVWKEQNEKYYLKSLDHQGMTFKQNDIKALRGKSLLNEIENILEEQNEANQQGQAMEVPEPHIKETYEDKTVFDDAASIIIHNMKRQSSMHHEDKKKIKQLIYHQVRDFLFYPRAELSDDEDENDTDGDSDKKAKDAASAESALRGSSVKEEKEGWAESRLNGLDAPAAMDKTAAGESSQHGNGDSADLDLADDDGEENYTLFFGNTNWYLFFRLHYKLCHRLLHFRRMSEKLAQQEERSKMDRKPSTALALRLRTPFEVEPDQYYSYFLDLIKNLMDCSIESSQYEDTLREMYGINSYTAFTMDKQVQQIVRTCHHLVTEEASQEMTEMFAEETLNQATGGPVSTRHLRQQAELNYQRRAEQAMADDNCFKFVFFQKSGEVHITLLDQGPDQGEEAVETERWAQYVERYVSMTPTDLSQHRFSDRMVKLIMEKPVFLSRNIISWQRENLSGPREEEEMEEEEELEEEGGGSEEDKEEKKEEEELEAGKPEKANAKLNFHLLECVKDVNEGKTMVADGAGVRFTINSLKMQHICWGAEMWYRRSAIHNARKSHRQVSLCKHKKFVAWLEKWHQEKVTPEEDQACEDWLMGRQECILPSTSTTRVEVNQPHKSPYYPYHRYRVKRRPPTPAPAPAPPPPAPPLRPPPTPPPPALPH